MTTPFECNPAAEVFPLLEGEHFAELCADIKACGLREPIWLDKEGKVLDGRNRYRACLAENVEPRFRTYDGDDLIDFVVGVNLHRRHLTGTQRAMLAAKLATMKVGDNQHTRGPANLPTHEVARKFNVSERAVRSAKKVFAEGTPEEIEAAEQGEVAVSAIVRRIRERTPKTMKKSGRRSENVDVRRQIWKQLKEGLAHLNSMPRPEDVVAIVKEKDRGGLVDEQLRRVIDWVKKFEKEWERGREADQDADRVAS